MKQTRNKGMMPDRSCGTEGRENSRNFELGEKEGNALTKNIYMTPDIGLLKKIFTLSFKTANAGFIAWCVLMFNSLICLGLWKITEARWIAFIGAGSFLLAIIGILLSFAAQTSNQIVRIAARMKGKDRNFFRKEEKECSLSKTVFGYCGFVKRVFKRNDVNRYKAKCTRNLNVRNNSRAYRSASRPSFAGTSGGDDSDGGPDPDSGDSDLPRFVFSIHVTSIHNLYRKSNSFQFPYRVLYGFGCWRLFCHTSTAKVVLL